MKKYIVTYKVIGIQSMVISAKNKKEAMKIALGDKANENNIDWDDTWSDFEADKILKSTVNVIDYE